MLQNNATAFGAYFIDSVGDIGFRYVFTTESGIGYEAFKVAVNELLRIADDPLVTSTPSTARNQPGRHPAPGRGRLTSPVVSLDQRRQE